MQQSISRDSLLENFDLLNSFQQSAVFTYIESLLKVRQTREKQDKRSLLDLSVRTEKDIQNIEDGRKRMNEWQIPEIPDVVHDVDFFARKAIEEANRIWDQQGLSDETMDEWLNEG